MRKTRWEARRARPCKTYDTKNGQDPMHVRAAPSKGCASGGAAAAAHGTTLSSEELAGTALVARSGRGASTFLTGGAWGGGRSVHGGASPPGRHAGRVEVRNQPVARHGGGGDIVQRAGCIGRRRHRAAGAGATGAAADAAAAAVVDTAAVVAAVAAAATAATTAATTATGTHSRAAMGDTARRRHRGG